MIENIKYKSIEEIEEIRKNIWNVSEKEYKDKVEKAMERQREFEREIHNRRMKEDFMYRVKDKIKSIFKK